MRTKTLLVLVDVASSALWDLAGDRPGAVADGTHLRTLVGRETSVDGLVSASAGALVAYGSHEPTTRLWAVGVGSSCAPAGASG